MYELETNIKEKDSVKTVLDFDDMNLNQLREMAEKGEITIPSKYTHVDEIREYLFLYCKYNGIGSKFGGK